MSRMASMQVLNNAFANLNHALNSYMANKNANRRMDMYEREQQLNEQFRQAMAAQNQANLDRNFAYQTDKNRRMEELNKIASLMGVASQYGQETANAYQNAAKGDPIATNLLIKDVVNATKRKELNDRYNQLEKMYFYMQKADRDRQYKMQGDEAARIHDLQMLTEKNKFAAAENEKNRTLQKDMETQKIAAAKNENIFKYAMPYIQSVMGNSESNSPVDMEKAVADYLRLSSMLNGTYRPNSNAENALNIARSSAGK